MKTHAIWLSIQAAFLFAVCLGCLLVRPIALLFAIAAWVLAPVCSLFSAEFITLRGVNPYLSWLLPPCMWALAGYLLSAGFSPSAGVMLVCALAALAGAAAGDVRLKNAHKGKMNKRR